MSRVVGLAGAALFVIGVIIFEIYLYSVVTIVFARW